MPLTVEHKQALRSAYERIYLAHKVDSTGNLFIADFLSLCSELENPAVGLFETAAQTNERVRVVLDRMQKYYVGGVRYQGSTPPPATFLESAEEVWARLHVCALDQTRTLVNLGDGVAYACEWDSLAHRVIYALNWSRTELIEKTSEKEFVRMYKLGLERNTPIKAVPERTEDLALPSTEDARWDNPTHEELSLPDRGRESVPKGVIDLWSQQRSKGEQDSLLVWVDKQLSLLFARTPESEWGQNYAKWLAEPYLLSMNREYLR